MIIGNGLIAKALHEIDNSDTVFFASGVSNSLETNPDNFKREENLLVENLLQNQNNFFVYFSTCSIYDSTKKESKYVLHKLKMENKIVQNSNKYLILRIGNVIGKGGNPNTMFNFFKNEIIQGKSFIIQQNAKRLLLDIDDIPKFITNYQDNLKNKIINLSYPYNYSIKEIVHEISQKLNKKAYFEEINQGDYYKVSFEESISQIFANFTPEEYLKNLINKHI